jgi:sulfite reductase (NADPH) flavoprotein alpha-component
MSIPLLPETAPFPSAQRAWLNGFFAGLLSAANAHVATDVTEVAKPQAAAPEEQFPWHDSTLPIGERLKLAEGKPRPRVLMAAMAQLDCGACGYLCRTYAEAIDSGAERDLTKCAPGGGETAGKLKELVKLLPPGARQPAARAGPAPAKQASVAYDRNHPYPARFVCATPLTDVGSEKDVRHVVLDIKGGGISYKPGDALGVFADNCPESAQELIDLLGAKGAEDVPGVDGQHASLREALQHDYTITRPTAELVELLARVAQDPDESKELDAVAAGDALDSYQVADLLLRYRTARPSPADFIATLAPLQPRLYSISSSQRAYPDEVHLTVGVVSYTNEFGRTCRGVASSHLCERLRPGQRLRVYVQPSHGFSMPSDGEVPLIMIGPGTGIAPFRAFLQHRKSGGEKGMTWLFFGDRRHAFDFLYRDELEQYLLEGVLSRLDTAFSRDQDEKVYVQDRMREQAARIWNWIESGAHLYVCGDAKRMAPDVDQALRDIIAEQGKMSPEQANSFVDSLAKNRRYQRDVY